MCISNYLLYEYIMEYEPIFRIKPINTNEAIIKYVKTIHNTEKITDEIVELDKITYSICKVINNSIIFKSIDDFEIVGNIYKCNIIGSHIVKSTKYPVLYLDIKYSRPMVSGSLFQLMYTINIDKKSITDNKQYVDMRFTGEWIRHIECDDELSKNYDTMITEILKTTCDTTILEPIKKEYDQLFKPHKIIYKSQSKLKEDILNLCNTEYFYNFIKIALKCRELNRRNKYGIKYEYTTPIITTDINDIKKQMISDDEIIIE